VMFVMAMRRRAQAVNRPPEIIVHPPELPDKKP
jgi:hypothetical protein